MSEHYWLINPRGRFDPFNVAIHGIEHRHVKGQPSFRGRLSDIRALLDGTVAVAHTAFDRVALAQACARAGHPPIACRWLDTAKVARRTWAECARSGYGLRPVTELIGYEFRHHHALEDAKAAGHILAAALVRTGLTLEAMIARCERPIRS